MCDTECPTLWCRTPHVPIVLIWADLLRPPKLGEVSRSFSKASRLVCVQCCFLNSGRYRLKLLSQICVILNRLVFLFFRGYNSKIWLRKSNNLKLL